MRSFRVLQSAKSVSENRHCTVAPHGRDRIRANARSDKSQNQSSVFYGFAENATLPESKEPVHPERSTKIVELFDNNP